MPNLPVSYEGFNLQVGPGNSDNNYAYNIALDNSNVVASGSISNPSQMSCYNSYYENDDHYGCSKNFQHCAQIPNYFGVGLSWYMMRNFYSKLDNNQVNNHTDDWNDLKYN